MKAIENIVNEFIDENEIGDEYIFLQISNVWNKYFSDTVKNNIQLVKFKKNVLYMRSDSAAWRKEIQIRSNEIIDKFNLKFEIKIIQKINISQT